MHHAGHGVPLPVRFPIQLEGQEVGVRLPRAGGVERLVRALVSRARDPVQIVVRQDEAAELLVGVPQAPHVEQHDAGVQEGRVRVLLHLAGGREVQRQALRARLVGVEGAPGKVGPLPDVGVLVAQQLRPRDAAGEEQVHVRVEHELVQHAHDGDVDPEERADHRIRVGQQVAALLSRVSVSQGGRELGLVVDDLLDVGDPRGRVVQHAHAVLHQPHGQRITGPQRGQADHHQIRLERRRAHGHLHHRRHGQRLGGLEEAGVRDGDVAAVVVESALAAAVPIQDEEGREGGHGVAHEALRLLRDEVVDGRVHLSLGLGPLGGQLQHVVLAHHREHLEQRLERPAQAVGLVVQIVVDAEALQLSSRQAGGDVQGDAGVHALGQQDIRHRHGVVDAVVAVHAVWQGHPDLAVLLPVLLGAQVQHVERRFLRLFRPRRAEAEARGLGLRGIRLRLDQVGERVGAAADGGGEMQRGAQAPEHLPRRRVLSHGDGEQRAGRVDHGMPALLFVQGAHGVWLPEQVQVLDGNDLDAAVGHAGRGGLGERRRQIAGVSLTVQDGLGTILRAPEARGATGRVLPAPVLQEDLLRLRDEALQVEERRRVLHVAVGLSAIGKLRAVERHFIGHQDLDAQEESKQHALDQSDALVRQPIAHLVAQRHMMQLVRQQRRRRRRSDERVILPIRTLQCSTIAR
eukprot:scaffold1867_cov247-Pinguiococcus_pyrenoidosus.AAC.23